MPKKKVEPTEVKRLAPASTPEGREDQVIALAYDLAEEQIRKGTASSQVITHFLRMGSRKERLEAEIMSEQKKLVAAKTKAIEVSERMDEIYNNAIEAMRRYSGQGDEEYDE